MGGKCTLGLIKYGKLNNLEKLYEEQIIAGCKMNMQLTIRIHCDPVTKPLGIYRRGILIEIL